VGLAPACQNQAMEELRDRVAVVTGAASGIGLGIAGAFVAEGMKVVMADVDEARLNREVAALGTDRVAGFNCDVSDASAVERLAEQTLGRFGAVHIICNNAGVIRSGRTWEISLSDWNDVLSVNLLGVVHGVHTFVPLILKSGDKGHVINIASMAAVVPVPGIAPYNVAKHGVLALSDTLRMELRDAGASIGVSVVMPGRVPSRLGRRPDDPYEPGSEATGPDLLPAGEVGHIVVDAVKTDHMYVFTHPERVAEVESRFARITGAELQADDPARRT
jgi:NAD(P)-dependent dehydrogenase (short-subunit alcohol dehydrogenase family)